MWGVLLFMCTRFHGCNVCTAVLVQRNHRITFVASHGFGAQRGCHSHCWLVSSLPLQYHMTLVYHCKVVDDHPSPANRQSYLHPYTGMEAGWITEQKIVGADIRKHAKLVRCLNDRHRLGCCGTVI